MELPRSRRRTSIAIFPKASPEDISRVTFVNPGLVEGVVVSRVDGRASDGQNNAIGFGTLWVLILTEMGRRCLVGERRKP
jgi:hypothetical protein